MKRKFTLLAAALMLLSCLAVPLGMRGQTRTEELVYTLDGTTTGGSNGYATVSDITQNGVSWKVTANTTTNPWRFGGNSISNEDRPAISQSAFNDNISKVVVTTGTTNATSVNAVKLVVSSNSNFNDATTLTENWVASSTITFTRPANADWSNMYFKIIYNMTVSGGSNKYAEFKKAEFYKENVPTYTLTDYSGDNGSISFAPASSVAAGTEVTLTATPAAGYDFNGNWYFYNEGVEEVTSSIQFVTGEPNKIVMPAYNLLVDAGFNAKPTFDVTCVFNDEQGLFEADPTSAYEGQTVTLSYMPETGYRLVSIAITKTSDGSATGITPTASENNFTFEMPGYAVTATATFEEIPTYTITFNAGTGSCNTSTITGYEGSSITLPPAEPSYGCGQAGWTFIGWATDNVTETTTTPATLTGSYTIMDDATLYAVYKDVVIGSVNTSNVFLNGSFNNNIITWTASGIVSIKQEKGSGGSAPSSSYVSAPRWYKDNKITITPSVSINSITVTAISETYATALANSTYTNATASVDGLVVTITPTNGSNAITIAMGNQSRLSSLIVNYATSTTYYNTAPDCVIQRTLTLPSNAQVLLFDGEENPIAFENGTALIGEGTEVRVSIDRINDCQLFESLSVTPTTGTVEVTELEPEVYYSFTMPTCDATLVISTTTADEYTLSVVKPEQVSFEKLKVGWEGEVLPTEIPASICEQAFVVVKNLTVSSGYLLNSVTLTYGDETIEVSKNGEDYGFVMPASNATLTFEVREAATYTLVTSTDGLVPGKHYIIASSKTNGSAKAMSYDRGNNRYAVEVTVGTQKITEVKELYEFAISGNTDNWTIYDKNEKDFNGNSTYGYLHAANSNNNNYLKTASNLNTIGDYGYWTITFDSEDGNAIITAKAGTNNIVRCNSSNNLFSCYSSGQQNVYLYVKDDDTALEFYSPTTLSALPTDNGEVYTVQNGGTLTFTGTNTNAANLIIEDGGQLITGVWVNATVKKNITAYTSADDGWNLISSPVNVNLGAAGIGLTTETTYDLYYLNEGTSKWINYKGSIDNGFNIQPQKGYLYANEANTTLSFSGSLQPNVENGCEVSLSKEGEGWNLVGNPFPFNAYVNKPYYVINGRTVEVYEGTDPVSTCTGIIVKATAANEKVTFRRTAFTDGAVNNGNIQMTLAQQATNRGTATNVDNAIVSFNEGSELGKFYFGTQNANLYISQGTEEYAIVSTEAQGEMPVSFRANENGQYTLTVNAEGVEMNYLHLIDNMTGADIDLLQTPSYTFNAKTTDYESRFRLVFAANNEDGSSTSSETFSFFSNGNWIITNEGEATLQVIDVTGRILSSETVNGNVSKSINAPAGVYVLRLINGDSVKTQKIVVR